ncbi:NlpC/P60 family protein [Actinoplanes sp. RD1]|uniref:hypothetical protein n=1 Tax=Actinoplanes sp. RD1 TaxID=3064538 RepID=UPI002740B409|nr:hypothetical protein [Actinoplanes sp. RD1]
MTVRGVQRVVAALTVAAVLVPAAPAWAAVAYGGSISRDAVIRRAADWLRRDLAYSQNNANARWDVNRGRRYRPDCSGLVSMAWALDPRRQGRALVTWELPSVSRRVPWGQLRRGDALLLLMPWNRAGEHVQLIQAWADRSRTRVWVIEQSGSADGMRRKVVSLPRAKRVGYAVYRYQRITG